MKRNKNLIYLLIAVAIIVYFVFLKKKPSDLMTGVNLDKYKRGLADSWSENTIAQQYGWDKQYIYTLRNLAGVSETNLGNQKYYING